MNKIIRRLSKTAKNRGLEASRIRTLNPISKIVLKIDKENKELLHEASSNTTKQEQAEIAEIRRINLRTRNRVGRSAQNQ